jgi:hypothetical protein
MRLLFIICESSVETHIMDILIQVGCPGYTRFTGSTGYGHNGRREGSSVWPGLNSIIMSGVPEEMVPSVLEAIEQFNQERAGRLTVKVFSVPAEEYM